jgi:hypothetical protein
MTRMALAFRSFSRHAWWAPALLLVAGLPLAFLEPVVIEGYDERVFHLPAIRKFAAELPLPDIRDYSAATGPLYHVVMSVPVRAGVDGALALRAISLLIAAAGALALWRFFAVLTTPRRAAFSASVVALSPYYLGPAIYLNTDSLAFGAMAVALTAWLVPASPQRGMAIAAATAIVTRHIFAWLIPLGALHWWRGRRSIAPLAWAALPLAALLVLFSLWGGTVPPAFGVHRASSGLLPLLVVLGTLGPWAVPLLPSFAAGANPRRAALVFAVLATAAAAYLIVSPLGDTHPAPWGGGLRTLGRYTGTLAGTSRLYWVAVFLGVLTVSLWAARKPTAASRDLFIALGLWALMQTANAAMHERYYHPFLLLILLALTADSTDTRSRVGRGVLVVMVITASVLRFVVHGGGLLRF